MCNWKLSIILVSLFLVGCITTSSVKKVEKPPQFHPGRPMPVQMMDVEWKLLTPTTHDNLINDGSAYSFMMLTWEDYLVMGQNMQNIIRGFKDYNSLLCYYRKDLKEVECVPYIVPPTEVMEKK